jgi:hypothetical protein
MRSLRRGSCSNTTLAKWSRKTSNDSVFSVYEYGVLCVERVKNDSAKWTALIGFEQYFVFHSFSSYYLILIQLDQLLLQGLTSPDTLTN